MLSREFTPREMLLLFICAVLGLGIFYYEFAWRGINDQIAQFDTAVITDELNVAQARATQIAQMEKTIEENTGKYKGDVAVYNNLANEVREMGRIMDGRADSVSLTWNDPALTDTTVRRDVNVSFHADGYAQMMAVLNALNTCKYRCILKDVSVSAGGGDGKGGIAGGSDVNVSLTVTFFETIEGASSTAGLVLPQSDDGEPGALETRAHAYEDS